MAEPKSDSEILEFDEASMVQRRLFDVRHAMDEASKRNDIKTVCFCEKILALTVRCEGLRRENEAMRQHIIEMMIANGKVIAGLAAIKQATGTQEHPPSDIPE